MVSDFRYTTSMTKRLVDIDDELLLEARDLIGGVTMKEAVNTALRELYTRNSAAATSADCRMVPGRISQMTS